MYNIYCVWLSWCYQNNMHFFYMNKKCLFWFVVYMMFSQQFQKVFFVLKFMLKYHSIILKYSNLNSYYWFYQDWSYPFFQNGFVPYISRYETNWKHSKSQTILNESLHNFQTQRPVIIVLCLLIIQNLILLK
jgi:hypothetical protein